MYNKKVQITSGQGKTYQPLINEMVRKYCFPSTAKIYQRNRKNKKKKDREIEKKE